MGGLGAHLVALVVDQAGKRVVLDSIMVLMAHEDEREGPTSKPPPPPVATSLTLSCPQGAKAKTQLTITGALAPALADAAITIT